MLLYVKMGLFIGILLLASCATQPMPENVYDAPGFLFWSVARDHCAVRSDRRFFLGFAHLCVPKQWLVV